MDEDELKASSAIEALLTEYRALREEILFRMRSADYFLVLTLVAVAAILGVGSANSARLFLVVPYISSVSAFLYLNQLRHVFRVSGYIRERIEPKLQKCTADGEVMAWEGNVRRLASVWPFLPLQMPNAALFFVLSGLGLVLALKDSFESVMVAPFWVLALMLTVLMLRVWYWAETVPPRSVASVEPSRVLDAASAGGDKR